MHFDEQRAVNRGIAHQHTKLAPSGESKIAVAVRFAQKSGTTLLEISAKNNAQRTGRPGAHLSILAQTRLFECGQGYGTDFDQPPRGPLARVEPRIS